MKDFSHFVSTEEEHLKMCFRENYQHDKKCFNEKRNTPAAVEACRVANRFIARYGLPEACLEFAWMERPKGTVILDKNMRTVMSQKYRSKKLTLGRRCAMYFYLPVEIPSLGLQANQLIGFVGDRKVLNSTVMTGVYLLCVPFTLKEWKLIGVVNRSSGETDMDLLKVIEVVRNAEDENKKTRDFTQKSENGDGMSKKGKRKAKGETVSKRTENESEVSAHALVESPKDDEVSQQFQMVDVSNIHEDDCFPLPHSPVEESYHDTDDEPQFLEGNYNRILSSSGSLGLPAPFPYYSFEVQASLSAKQEELDDSEGEFDCCLVFREEEQF